ncbi:MAG: 30S ribosomal protein S8 [Bdellovibrionales bacterium]|nr:30S ribosomal protein S8 [Bdellovibrionales bacterium]
MAHTDPIADFLTRIRNAQRAKHSTVVTGYSNMNLELSRILKEEGFLADFETLQEEGAFPQIKVSLKYNDQMEPLIQEIKRISTPGCRRYANREKLESMDHPFSMLIVSTSKGIMSDAQAKAQNVGGELICQVS